MKRKKKALILFLSLIPIFTIALPTLAAIPSGTVVFGNGQALDLGYANSPANTAEVMQDVVAGGGIYVINFSGAFINNTTTATLTPSQITALIPAVTYKDAQGKVEKFAIGNGAAVSTTTTTINAIDTTKTVAIKGLFNDAYVRVFLLSNFTQAEVTSVTLADGTVLPYSSVDGSYEQDIPYTGTLPTSVSVVLTTASGSQTLTVPVK